MEKEPQLFRSHPPEDDPEDRQQRDDKHYIIKDQVGKCTCLQGGDIRYKEDRGKIDLARAGKFKKRDDKPRDNSGKEVMYRSAFFSNGLMDPLFQKIGELEFHLRRPSPFQLDIVVETERSQKKSEGDGQQIDDL